MWRWIGWTGRTSSGEREPCRIQYSISHMTQVNAGVVDDQRHQVVGGEVGGRSSRRPRRPATRATADQTER